VRLGVVRDFALNSTDLMTFQGIQREGVEVTACGTHGVSVKNMSLKVYSDVRSILDEFDVIDVPDAFYSFTQHALAYHDNVFATIWDNLPYAKSKGFAGSLLTRAKGVICRSLMAHETMLWENVPQKKLFFTPAAVDTELFSPLEEDLRSLRPRVLFAARLVPEKGLWDLIIAMKNVDAELWVCGPGDVAPYMDLAERVGVPVKYFGAVTHEGVANLMKECHIFVLPCIPILDIEDMYHDWVEQFGVSLIEAMSSGLPVIASNLGAIPEIVLDGVTGVLVPPRSWHELHYTLKTLVTDAALRKSMGKEGRRVVEERYSSEVVGNELLEIYSG